MCVCVCRTSCRRLTYLWHSLHLLCFHSQPIHLRVPFLLSVLSRRNEKSPPSEWGRQKRFKQCFCFSSFMLLLRLVRSATQRR